MNAKCFFPFLAVRLRGLLSSLFDGCAMLCLLFVEPVVFFQLYPMVPLWTMTELNWLILKLNTTISLLVSFLFVCEISIHGVLTSPENCAFVDYEGLNN